MVFTQLQFKFTDFLQIFFYNSGCWWCWPFATLCWINYSNSFRNLNHNMYQNMWIFIMFLPVCLWPNILFETGNESLFVVHKTRLQVMKSAACGARVIRIWQFLRSSGLVCYSLLLPPLAVREWEMRVCGYHGDYNQQLLSLLMLDLIEFL